MHLMESRKGDQQKKTIPFSLKSKKQRILRSQWWSVDGDKHCLGLCGSYCSTTGVWKDKLHIAGQDNKSGRRKFFSEHSQEINFCFPTDISHFGRVSQTLLMVRFPHCPSDLCWHLWYIPICFFFFFLFSLHSLESRVLSLALRWR